MMCTFNILGMNKYILTRNMVKGNQFVPFLLSVSMKEENIFSEGGVMRWKLLKRSFTNILQKFFFFLP